MLYRTVKIQAIMAILISPILAEANSSLKNIPEGFEDFFSDKATSVKLRNLDGSFSDPMTFIANFKSVKIPVEFDQQQIIDFLQANQIDSVYHGEILSLFRQGFSNQSLCKGYLPECELQPEKYELVYNASTKEIYLFVNQTILDFSNSKNANAYHPALSVHSGVINNVDVYMSAYLDQDTSISVNDQLTVGLPYGYLSSNVGASLSFSESDSQSESTLYDLSYNLDWNDKTLQAGYFQYTPNMNSTSFLSGPNSLTPQLSLTLGSSKNMLIGGHNVGKQLNFYSPQSGNVELIRDGRIIYQGNVIQGQNSINYSELPAGRYEAELMLRIGGEPSSQGVFFIFNNLTDHLAQGDVDYLASVGLASSGNGITHIRYENGDKIESKALIQGRVSYQATPTLMLGIGAKATDDEILLETGFHYNFVPLDTELTVNGHLLEDGYFLNSRISSNWGNLNYEKMDTEGGYLATYLYNPNSYEKLFWTSSYRFGRKSSLYAVYTLMKDEFSDQEERVYDDVTLGYRLDSYNSSSFDITFQTDSDFEEGTVSFTWTLPLSNTVDLSSSLSSDYDSVYQATNSITKEQLFESDSINSSMNLTNIYDRHQDRISQSGMITANTITKNARLGGSLYADSGGTVGASGSLSSSQIFAKDWYVSSRAAQSYVALDIKQQKQQLNDDEVKGFVTVSHDGRNLIKGPTTDLIRVVPLNNYSEYGIRFDAESIGLSNTGDKKAEFYAMPGKVLNVNPNVHRTVSFISGFSDINNKLVDNVECFGDACLSVVQLVDGVYRITVLEGLDFELLSNDTQCFIPKNESTVYMNFGKNYCLPTNYDDMYAVEVEGKGFKAVYVGLFSDKDLAQNRVLDTLKSYNYNIIKKDVGTLKAVYIAHNKVKMDELYAKHFEHVEQLKTLALEKHVNNIVYPVAKR